MAEPKCPKCGWPLTIRYLSSGAGLGNIVGANMFCWNTKCDFMEFHEFTRWERVINRVKLLFA